ncbi:hypothetical protein AGMMS50249_3030 [candidate division SR1 bacterium]|nr:hypothetical protein AGMMS50249_3030 [candidate division SR1 bacterium]
MKKAFTLVEMLLVIVVFGVGILTVLYGITQTLRIQDSTEMMIDSSFFAREGIELMYALRDANYAKSQPRNCVFKDVNIENTTTLNQKDEKNPYCSAFFTGGDVLKLSLPPKDDSTYIVASVGPALTDFETNFNNYQLVYCIGVSDFYYGYSGDNVDNKNCQTTRYARYILIKSLKDGQTILPSDNILKIESHVLYRKGGFTGESIMESFIGNY